MLVTVRKRSSGSSVYLRPGSVTGESKEARVLDIHGSVLGPALDAPGMIILRVEYGASHEGSPV